MFDFIKAMFILVASVVQLIGYIVLWSFRFLKRVFLSLKALTKTKLPGEYITPEGWADKFFLRCLEQPHLLIAGQTGSGKSVLENGLIYTLLFRFPLDVPNGAQFILCDSKGVELMRYKNLPHTLRYAVELDDIVNALEYAMRITKNRFIKMQEQGLKKYVGSDVFIFIDEGADLMLTQKKQVQPLIQRLAQIGRAANVHIIFLTQCPLREVIPTQIKVNFDARIGLKTACEQDSRNILGRSDCARLPEHGKCIYNDPSDIFRTDVPFYSEAELDKQVNWWLKQA